MMLASSQVSYTALEMSCCHDEQHAHVHSSSHALKTVAVVLGMVSTFAIVTLAATGTNTSHFRILPATRLLKGTGAVQNKEQSVTQGHSMLVSRAQDQVTSASGIDIPSAPPMLELPPSGQHANWSVALAGCSFLSFMVLATWQLYRQFMRLTPVPEVRVSNGLPLNVQPPIAMLTTVSIKKPKGIKGPVFSEKCEQVGITLTRFMNEMVRANPDLAELESVFASIQTAGKAISKLVQRAPLDGMLGKQGAVNVQGEEQKKLDVITNDLLKRVLKYTGRMGVIASEEEPVPVEIDNTAHASYELEDDDSEGRYVTVFDPLDGSSNVDAGIPVGTIFGIFERDEACHLPENYFPGDITNGLPPRDQQCLRLTLRAGKSLVAAGYVLYSSSTYFVFTMGAGVNGFTLDHSLGEFILTHPHITIPDRGYIYSVNSANRRTWDKPMQVFLDSLADGTNVAGKEYTSRYIGSMVGDVHRTLMYGGVFAYPADAKNAKGKLRLLYEAAPMSFLIEQAGGKSSTGIVRIMDIPPSHIHQRVPCVMGGKGEMEEMEKLYQKLADPALIASHTKLLYSE